MGNLWEKMRNIQYEKKQGTNGEKWGKNEKYTIREKTGNKWRKMGKK